MFKQAIVRIPGKNFQDGLTTSNLGTPDYSKTILQHSNYIKALSRCGLKLHVLEANERFPDSTFVEDTAVVNKELAIITNFGVLTRKGEELEIKEFLEKFYRNIECIENPGTLEGGDVLKIENQYYIGLSKRTNREGANQLKEILEKFGYSCYIIKLINLLHLKTGIAYVGDNIIILSDELFNNHFFKQYDAIKVDTDEAYAVNCIRVNDFIIIAKGYEKLKNSLLDLGYKTIEVEMSEFMKMDGGISCLSIRF
jgi:dimethylargininase